MIDYPFFLLGEYMPPVDASSIPPHDSFLFAFFREPA